MPGGYVLQKRDVMNTKSVARTGTLPKESIVNEGYRGFHLAFPSTDLRTHQETYSFRTNKYSEYPDLTSGNEILRYFLIHGIPDKIDTGHDFWTTRSWTNYSHREAFVQSASGNVWAKGCLSPGAPPIPSIPSLDVNFYGNRAISRTAPTSPNANLAQTSAEIIREKGIALPGSSFSQWLNSRALFYRSIGKEYLNVAFGWQPFINDLFKIVKQMLEINEEIRKYTALSELDVDRRYDFLPLSTTSSEENDFGSVNMGPGSNIASWAELYNGSTSGKLRISRQREERIYFTARYWYSVDPGNGLLNKLHAYEQLSNKLLGTRITPTVLWELAPWSWLIDWFVDIQSSITTAGLLRDDGLQMPYAYLMRETRASEAYTVSGLSFVSGPTGPFTATSHLVKKERVRGTPFGFGVNPDGISAGKWAILAALAISKGPRRLPKLPQGEPTD